MVARTAKYLNWRYAEHPQQHYELLTARHGSGLHGYLTHHSNGEDCVIDDLVAETDAVCLALLAEAIARARASGVHTLSAPWLGSHPGTQLLEKCGFRPREASPVVLLALAPGKQGQIGPADGCCWYLSHGDWES